MQDLTRFALAANLKWLLLAGLALVALMLLYGSWRGAVVNVDRLRNWTRHPAEIVSTAGDTELEVEIAQAVAETIPGVRYDAYPTPYQPGNTRILIPRGPALPFPSNGTIVLLQNPASPADVVLLSHIGMWAHILVKLLAGIAVAGLGYWLLGQGWGEDLSWSAGGWVPTEHLGTAAGARADPALAIREPGGSRYMPLFWTALFGVLLLGAFWGAPPERPFYVPLLALVLGVPCALAAITAVESWTRHVGFDDAGLCDATFFGAKRVPWDAIAAVRRENINADSQASYDRARKRSGSRPQSIWVQRLVDAEGRQILGFGDALVPQERFAAMLARAGGRGTVGSSATPAWAIEAMDSRAGAADDEAAEDQDEAQETAMEAEMARMEAEFRQRSEAHDRTMRSGWLLVMSPFLLFTLWLGWKAAYFRLAAERADGRVVEVEGGELRMLTVEFTDGAGKAHRVESDGTRANLRYDTGDTVRVFYHAENPDNARLDLFLELWLGTLISAGITALVSIPLFLMR